MRIHALASCRRCWVRQRQQRRMRARGILTARLRSGCWASQGYSNQGCAALEQQLRACMDARVALSHARCATGRVNLLHATFADFYLGRKHTRRRRALSITTSRASTRRSSARTSGRNEAGSEREREREREREGEGEKGGVDSARYMRQNVVHRCIYEHRNGRSDGMEERVSFGCIATGVCRWKHERISSLRGWDIPVQRGSPAAGMCPKKRLYGIVMYIPIGSSTSPRRTDPSKTP